MNFRDIRVISGIYVYAYDGVTWQLSGAPALNCPIEVRLDPGAMFSLQSIESSFIHFDRGGVLNTDNRITGKQLLQVARGLNQTDILFNSSVPICRYYRDVPFIEIAGSEASSIYINSIDFDPNFPALSVSADNALGITPFVAGDIIQMNVRVQYAYTMLISDPTKNRDGFHVNETANYKRARGLVSRD